MTGYTVHTGSNDKFREGWDQIFKAKKKKSASQPKTGNKKKKTGKDASAKGRTK